MGIYIYMCVYSVTFYCCYKPLHLHWAFAVPWSFPFTSFFLASSVFFFFNSFFFIILTFHFFKPIIFFLHYSFVCLSYCSFPLAAAAAEDKSLQLYPTVCDPTDGSPAGSSVPGTLQARILEWVAIFFSFPLEVNL